jgi:glycosyltransferase involved in cell wall biosynthesis
MQIEKDESEKNFELALVIPIYNEEEVLEILFTELRKFQDLLSCEIVFVNDGSRDNSLQLLTNSGLRNCIVIDLNQNYGHQMALCIGLSQTRGRYVVTLDADLQHPLELIPFMLDLLMKGSHDVVQTFQKSRTEGGRIKKFASEIFWKILQGKRIVLPMKNSGDFRAMTQGLVQKINLEPNPKVLRFLIPRLTNSIHYLEFTVNPRVAGKTKYTIWKMIQLAKESYFSIYVNPLLIIGRVSIVISILSLVALIFALLSYVFYSVEPGWTSLISVNLMLGGLNLAALAILGQYISKIYEKVFFHEQNKIREVYKIE